MRSNRHLRSRARGGNVHVEASPFVRPHRAYGAGRRARGRLDVPDHRPRANVDHLLRRHVLAELRHAAEQRHVHVRRQRAVRPLGVAGQRERHDGVVVRQGRGQRGQRDLHRQPGHSTAGARVQLRRRRRRRRALGSIASGTNVSAFGATFVNTGSTTLNNFTINFTMEQWRNGGSGNPNTLSFGYALGATDIVNGTFTAATSLDATSVVNAAGGGSLNGNLPANQAARGATVSGLNWLPGQTLVVRWRDNDEARHRQRRRHRRVHVLRGGRRASLTWNPAGAGGNTWTTSPRRPTGSTAPPPPPSPTATSPTSPTGVGHGQHRAAGVAPGATNVSNDERARTLRRRRDRRQRCADEDRQRHARPGQRQHVQRRHGRQRRRCSSATTNASLGAPARRRDARRRHARVIVATSHSIRTLTLTTDTTSTIDTAGVGQHRLRRRIGRRLAAQGGRRHRRRSTALTTSAARPRSLGGALVLGQRRGLGQPQRHDRQQLGRRPRSSPTAIRVNFNSGSFGGGGTIRVSTSGAVLSTTGALIGQTPTIGNNVVLNANNVAGAVRHDDRRDGAEHGDVRRRRQRQQRRDLLLEHGRRGQRASSS